MDGVSPITTKLRMKTTYFEYAGSFLSEVGVNLKKEANNNNWEVLATKYLRNIELDISNYTYCV